MQRTTVPLSVAIIVLVALLAAGRAQWSVAQEDASPVAGATIEILDTGQPMDVPDKVLNFVRVTLEPDGYFAAHGHPGAQIWYVDAGAISTTVVEGTMRLTHASEDATAASTEEIGPGMQTTVAEGDSVFFDHDVVHTVQNAGDELAVVLIAAILEAGEPEVIFAEHGGHSD